MAHQSGGGSGTPPVGQTSVFVQTGLKIRELPLVVTKVHNVLQIAGMDPFRHDLETPTPYFRASDQSQITAETREIMAGFDRCPSTSAIFTLLETIPLDEVTPDVAVHALQRVIDLENPGPAGVPPLACHRQTLAGNNRTSLDDSLKPFQRIAFINMLLDIVYRSRDPRVILAGLKIVSQDQLPDEATAYKERMCQETLACVGEGVFTLRQVCDAIQVMGHFYPDKKRCFELADKFWSPLMDQMDPMTVREISAVFATLPFLKQSRSLILTILENKIVVFWQELQTRDILEILRVLTKLKVCSDKVLRVVSQWLTVNIHSLSEEEVLAIIYCFQNLEYIDSRIISTMEKYIKIRGCHIKEKDLMATFCEYCLDFRVRSPVILEGVGEYFIAHGKTLTTPQLYSMTRIFGQLNYCPPNGFKFWQIVEEMVDQKFGEFPPKEILGLLLSFIMIERYPLNFVRKIFNPYFLDRLDNQAPEDVIDSRFELKLFDNCFQLEVDSYSGPFLPKMNKYVSLGRPKNMKHIRLCADVFGNILNDLNRVQTSVTLSALPLHPFYVMDLMIYPTRASAFLRFGAATENSGVVVGLIRNAEDFDRHGKRLLGPKALQLRLLKTLGFKVMEINSNTINRLKVYPNKLESYLSQLYHQALSP
ncbi:hypothetical protein TCAL_05697 [Tigriopus californicus]|uniref:FAST kinase leucine-rich domain-containing protein n=2 Tax=Tigriopus californicus TaxID=6832 RepID=A0A553N807_TIGCA|nr:hypothetical protein TCAL_05697 [Tigriopus californicus]